MFDVKGAREAGATDDEIVQFLSSKYGDIFDVEGAWNAGADLEDIAGHVAKRREERDASARAQSSGARAAANKRAQEAAGGEEGFLGNLWGYARDVAGTVGGATAGLVENVGQLAGMVPGVGQDNFLTRSGKEAREFYDETVKSDLFRRNRAVAEAEDEERAPQEQGFTGGVRRGLRHLSDPYYAAQFLADQGVNLVPGGAAARGGRALGMGGKALEATVLGANAAMQGASVGGQAYDELMALPEEAWQSDDRYKALRARGYDDKAAREKVANFVARTSGGAGALLSVLGNKLPFAQGLERMAAGIPGEVASGVLGKAGRVAAGALGETAGELVEEVGGQVAGNLGVQSVDPSKDWTEGLGETAIQSAIGGGVMGGVNAAGEQFLSAPKSAPQEPPRDGLQQPQTAPPQPAPPVDVSLLDRPDPVAERNLAAQRARRDQEFDDVVKADPATADAVKAWREMNPAGEVDSFLEEHKAQGQERSVQQAQESPKVQQAQADAVQAEQKLQAAQQVPNADPTQAPPAELTPEEARHVMREGTGKLEKEAQAAQETVRTEIQTVQAQQEQATGEDLAGKVEQVRKEREKNAKLVFKDLLSSMAKQAQEIDESKLEEVGKAAGLPEESIQAKVALVRKAVADAKQKEREKAAKEKARGGQGEQGRQTPAKAPSAPAAPLPTDSGSPMGETVTAPAPADASTTQTQEGGSNGQEEGQGRQGLLNQDAQALLSIFKEKGRQAAGEEFQRIVKDRGLKQWEGAALADAFHKAAKAEGIDTSRKADARPKNGVATPPRGNEIQGGSSTGGTRDAKPESAAGGAGGAPERSGGTPLAGEPGGELPGNAREVPAGGEPQGAPGADGQAGGAGLRGDERGPGAGDRDAGGDVGSSEGVPSGQLGSQVDHASTLLSPGGNFNAAEEDVGPASAGTAKQFEQNIAALQLLKKLQADGATTATPEEKRVLGKWNGWGPIARWLYPEGKGFTEADKARFAQIAELVTEEELRGLRASTLNAYYTSPEVVDAMWGAVRDLGFKGGVVVDPSMGSGIFFGRMPRDLMDSSKLRGVELERVTAGIAKYLYEQADIAQGGYQDQRFNPGSVDLHISNVPFGNMVLNDRETGWRGNIHNFFFQKAVRATKPGGLVVFITGKGTMDAMAEGAGGAEFRRAIQKEARFLGAVRLPNNAFLGSANTKVITDIIVLQKRAEGDTGPEVDWFERGTIAGKTLDGAPAEFAINRYYQDNPDRVLGEIRPGSIYRKAETAADTDVVSTGRDIAKEVRELLGKLDGVNRQALELGRTNAIVDASIRAAKNLPPKSLMLQEGKWFKTGDDGRAEPFQVDEKAGKVLDAVLPVRDALRTLLAAQLEGGDLDAARAALNDAYDTFAQGGKTLHGIRRFVELDESNAPSLLSLEVKKDGKFQKAEIFTKNTQKKAERSQEAKTADDALLLSLDEKGGVDLAFMAERSGMSEAELLAALPGKVFKDPETGAAVLSDVYLSGDVAGKLAVARAAGEEFAPNVTALEGALPAEVPPEEVRIRLGAGWIPDSMVNQFLAEVGTRTRVRFNEQTGQWKIERGGDSGVEFLLNCAFNFAPATVTVKFADGTEAIDPKRSAVARIMYDRLQKRFGEWMIDTPERSEFVRKAFNEKLGGLAVPKFDGTHLSFPGMTEFWRERLRPHQRAAVWRILTWGSTILHHDVGTGKTATMIAAMMELRRTGKANKPMAVVPNHIVDQFGKDALQMYPGAKILVLGKKELGASSRRVTMAKIATGDWDLVVVPHSSFGLLPMSKARLEAYAQEEIDALTDALEASLRDKSLDGRQRKQLEKRIQALEERIKKQVAELEGDPGPFFDELGVDAMAVDEAHEFKNLANITKAGRIKGVSVSDASKALDLFMKVKHLSSVTGGRNVIFATGTPITRTIVETHTYLRYLAPGMLKRLGCQALDQFLMQFGAVSSEAALPPGGGSLRVEQTMKWQNVPQLSMAWQQISDRVSAASTAIVRPPIKNGKPTMVTVPRNPLVGALMEEIAENIAAFSKKGPGGGGPNILTEMMRARKVALDMRLLDPGNPDLPESKVNECVRSTLEIYRAEEEVKGTQIIWCDLGVPNDRKGKAPSKADDSEVDEDEESAGTFNLYQDIKDKLVAGGIPADEIQFIHDHRTDDKKGALFAKINSGEVRVILASSRLMATGANIQARLAAMHHLDATWNPADMEQRNGRGIRQGNLYAARGGVDVRYYSTEKTFDAYFWQTLERKANVIEAFFSGNLSAREMEDAGMGAVTAAQAKAEASGSPEMFQYVMLERRVQELEQAKAEVELTSRRARASLASMREKLESTKARLDLIPEGTFSLEDVKVAGKTFETSGELAENIRERWVVRDKMRPFTVFSVGGMNLVENNGTMQLQAPWAEKKSSLLVSWASLDGNGVNALLRTHSPAAARNFAQGEVERFGRMIQSAEKKAAQTFEEQEELNRIMPEYFRLAEKLMGQAGNGSSDAEQGGIQQPDDGTTLYDMGDLDIKGVRKGSIGRGLGMNSRIQENGLEDSVRGARVADVLADWEEISPLGAATIDGDKYVLFRSKGEARALPLNVYLQMAQKGGSFRVDPSFEKINSRNEEMYQTIKLASDPRLHDYARRLLRMPTEPQIPKGMEALADLTPERLAEAGKKLSGVFFDSHQVDYKVQQATIRLRESLMDLETAEELSRELEGSVALLAGGTLDQKTAAAVYRKIQRKTSGAGKRVHKGLAGVAAGLELVALSEIADRITEAGKRFSLEGYGNYWINDAMLAVNQAYGTNVNRYQNRGTAELLLGYAADLFKKATGKDLDAETEGEFREWVAGEVTLNSNRFPALMVAGMGILGATAIHPGAGQYLAAGMVAWGMMHLAKKVWNKVSFLHSPRTQIAGVVSRNGRGVDGFRILEMLDQALMRAAEIAGTPSLIVKKMRRASGGSADTGRALSDFVEGGEIAESLRGLGINAKAVLGYFTRKMEEAGVPVLDDYLPRVYLHEGFERALKDEAARAYLLEDLIPKIEEFHPEWIEDAIARGVDPEQAAEDAALYLLDQLAGRARDEEYGLSRPKNATVYESGHAKGRKLLFKVPHAVPGSDGQAIELVERDFFKIMDRYIPQMSRTLAEKEVVNASEINAWLRGIQGEDKAQTKARMLNHIQNDLSGRLNRVFDKTWTERLRNVRILNSVLYLGLSIWYPVRNFLFATPLAMGLTDIPAAVVGAAKGSLAMPLMVAESLAARPWVKGGVKRGLQGLAATMASGARKARVSLAQVEIAGAMTQQVFDDTTGRKGQIARAIMAPSLLTQNAVDVWGFYAGRHYADTLVRKASKDGKARELLEEALGVARADGAIQSGALDEADRDRIGLYYKGLISGTSRSLNLPSFMGNDVGRTVFQFGSIPMEQTRTLATKILPDPIRSARYATGATLAGLLMLLKLWAAVHDPEDPKEDEKLTWIEESPGWQKFAYIMAQSGAPQMFGPGFDYMSGMGRPQMSISELMPMPTISRATGLVEAPFKGLKAAGKALGEGYGVGDVATVAAMPLVRELVNNQSSLPRSLGFRVGKAPVEEELSGR